MEKRVEKEGGVRLHLAQAGGLLGQLRLRQHAEPVLRRHV